METINLNLPNMKSVHCQITVSSIVKNLGAQIKSIAPAQTEIELRDGLTKEVVITAIEKAGYKVNR